MSSDSSQAPNGAIAAGALAIVATIEDLSPLAGPVVATPTSSHFEVIPELLQRRIPIFTENPMTADEKEAAKLVSLASDRFVRHEQVASSPRGGTSSSPRSQWRNELEAARQQVDHAIAARVGAEEALQDARTELSRIQGTLTLRIRSNLLRQSLTRQALRTIRRLIP